MNSDNRWSVTPGFCILWAVLLMVLPLRLLLAAGVAAAFHEACHALAIRLLGGKVLNLTIGAGGMVMETTPMTPGRELLCALAGPGGSFLLAALLPWLPYVGICALFQGCFNLLPLYPLDGGRALGCGLALLFPRHRAGIMGWTEAAVLTALLLAALRFGPGAVAAWGMLAVRKIPCKARCFGVQ